MPSQGIPGATVGGDAVARSRLGKHNRARGRLKQRFFFGGQIAKFARRIEIAHHDGQRLAVAVLALAQARHGCFVRCVHAE